MLWTYEISETESLNEQSNEGQDMPNECSGVNRSCQAAFYQIRIEGHLGEQWAEWFDGLAVSQEMGGETMLSGLVVDQAALYGLLKKVRDLGMPLVAVKRVAKTADFGARG